MVQSGLEAEALEVYHHVPSVSAFDLVVSPVHLGPKNSVLVEARMRGKKIITHHQAVGEILLPILDPEIEVMEVTGTHSKTSTALLTARIISHHKKVLSHTTRGLELWENGKARLLETGMSITPGNVIPALEAATASRARLLIAEVSLGGTGLCNFGVLTSLSGDYHIADGSKWASTAKLQMLSLARDGSKLIANADALLSPDLSFSDGGQIRVKPDRLIFKKVELPISLGEDLDYEGYRVALAGAAAAAAAEGVDKETIAMAMQGFDGFSGRMKIRRLVGSTLYDNSNSGLKVRDVALALDRARGTGLVVVVGEESETVCEGMDIPALSQLLRQRRSEMAALILVGQRLAPLAVELRALAAKNLVEGLEAAEVFHPERLLSCVKCFR
ncbi:UDP-N-acetylmuramoylalanine--D-glutamate ligase [uncultured archaeon]|nr:UDP-N-acetylmuramoylalanine--D-glutamate ligase [uncultured archaeon]